MSKSARSDAEAVLTSTHNLCFGAKIRKIGIPLHTPVLLHKSGVQGVYIAWTCFPDGKHGVAFSFFVYQPTRDKIDFCVKIALQNTLLSVGEKE